MLVTNIFSTFILTLPIFIVIVIGFAVVKLNILDKDKISAINEFVLNICIPILIFSITTQAHSSHDINITFILCYGLVVLFIMAVLLPYFKSYLKYNTSQSIILGFGSGASNSIFFGFPLALIIVPEIAVQLFYWVILAESFIIIPATILLANHFCVNGATGKKRAHIFPIIIGISIIAGIMFNIADISVPPMLDEIRHNIVTTGSFLALFIIGGSLATSRITQAFRLAILVPSFTKLFLHPLILFLVLFWLPNISHDVLVGGVLFATLPMMSLFVILAYRYQIEEFATLVLTLSVALSIITIPLIISFVNV